MMNSTEALLELADVPKQVNFNGTQVSHSPPVWAVVHTATLTFCSLLLVFIFCLGSYGNLVVFLSFFDPAFRKFRTNFDFMILNLSFCDLFICCVTTTMFALVLYLDAGGVGGVSKSFCFAFHLTSSGFIIMSLETVAVIALHRLRMVLGQQPNRTASFPCTLALTALLWTSSFTMAALLTMRAYPRRDGPCLPHFGLGGGRARLVLYAYLADFAFCVGVVSVSYLLIAQTLRKNAQVRKCPIITVAATCTPPPPPMAVTGFEGVPCSAQGPLYRNQMYNKLQNVQTHAYTNRTKQAVVPGAAQGATCCQLASTVNLATAKDSKAVVTCVVIVFSVLLCCLPMGISLAQDVLSPESTFAHYQFELCGFVLIFLKSAINPFVYSRNSAGLRRRVLSCLHWAALGLLCCKHKTRLHAMGKGSLEVNRNKSSHHETNSAYVLSPKAQRRLVDQACGPSQSRECGPSPRGARRPHPASTSTPINTRIEPYYSIYNSSPSAGPSSPTSLQPASSQTFAFAKSYVAMHYHTHQDTLQDFESTSVQQIPIPSV
ncbi:probable G-protein coupled receptor 75 [Corythoichthys intestinalis]|uniref:probable G-protein coupled receptor 75 n=1 Tax=Corythoichthys intestinalis TaxID=161448 RepID=UPI0025A6713D|nr:probable G-protein coupled receptor 75 [Corythoichthys intestinalis]XP_061793963.1 probable G-protein coupled receptor 75 [Nerophis lumbriciformis]